MTWYLCFQSDHYLTFLPLWTALQVHLLPTRIFGLHICFPPCHWISGSGVVFPPRCPPCCFFPQGDSYLVDLVIFLMPILSVLFFLHLEQHPYQVHSGIISAFKCHIKHVRQYWISSDVVIFTRYHLHQPPGFISNCFFPFCLSEAKRHLWIPKYLKIKFYFIRFHQKPH